ncbi:dynamin family protein [Belliella sp. DSM 107340]|uniref:Dynamin family protein n=1 Tax=Belliella calami TaxID=2923436 RepID=A0ABS9URY2_9BACT|nr:dynamin family protein [Belliella calami]MCH7399204.1 dynamin family protein [Belliella calami]
MSKVLKTIQINTGELQEIENYLHRTELVLSSKVSDEKIKEIQNTYLQIHDKRISLEAKVKDANLGNINLQIGVVGSFSTGKSSFLNSLIGEDLLGTDLMPTTAKITKLIYGKRLRLFKVFKDEQIDEITLPEYKEYSVHGSIENQNSSEIKKTLSDIKYFKVEYPSFFLERFTLIDTPGFSSTSKEDDELTKSMIPELDVLLWLFDANKTGDADEMELINDLGKDTKIIAIINKIDLKPPSAREKILLDLKSRYPFEEVFLYSSKKVFESTKGQKKIRETWSSLIEEILSNQESNFKEISIKFKENELSIGENNFDIKNFNQNGFQQYHSLLSIQLENLRYELRSIFESLYNDELENLIYKAREKIETLLRDQSNLLKDYESELHRLKESEEELFKNVEEIQQSVFEVYFGNEFYSNLFSKFFEFHNENGWFSSTDSLKIKNIEIEVLEKELIEKFEIYLTRIFEKYSDLLQKLSIKSDSILFSEESYSFYYLKNLCYNVLSQTSITIAITAGNQYIDEISNRENVKKSIIEDFFYTSPLELVSRLTHYFLNDDFYGAYFYQIKKHEEFIMELTENIELIKNLKNYE